MYTQLVSLFVLLQLARFTRVMRAMHEESFNLEFSTQPFLQIAPLWMLCGNSRLRCSGSARVNLVSRMWIQTGYLTALGLQNLLVYALWVSQQLSVYFIVLPASILTLFAYSLNGCVVTKNSFGKHSLYSKHKGNHSYFSAHINNPFAFRWRIADINFGKMGGSESTHIHVGCYRRAIGISVPGWGWLRTVMTLG